MVNYMADSITLGCNLAILAFVLFGILWGLIRGLKKTLSRGLFLLVISVITIFVTTPIITKLLEIPISIETNINGSITSSSNCTILEYLTLQIENLLGENFVSNYPDLASSLVAIPIIFINSIAYAIIFWLLKILLLPINALLNLIILRPRRNKETLGFAEINDPNSSNTNNSITPLAETPGQENQAGMFIKKEDEINKNAPSANANVSYNYSTTTPTQVAKPETKKEINKRTRAERKANKPKKHRLLGGLVGIAVSLIVMFNTLVPIYGVLNIISFHKTTRIHNITQEELSLSSMSNGLTDDIIKEYELSVLGRVSKLMGIEKLGLMTFDKVTTTKINGENVVLRNDIHALIDTIQTSDNLIGKYEKISQNGIENMSQEELSELIDSLNNVIKKAEKVKLVDALSDYIIPVAVEYIIYNEIKLSDNPTINEAVVDTLVTLAKQKDIKIFDELKSIVDILKYLSDQNLLIRIVKNDFSDILTVIDGLEEEFGTNLSNKIFQLKMVNTIVPNLLNIGLTVFDEMTNFGYVENNATIKELEESLTSFINNSVDIAKSLSYDSPYYVTDSSLEAIGGLLDTFRNSKLFNTETYNNLINYTIDQIKGMTTDIIPENFKQSFNNHLLQNISNVTDWKKEMKIISDTLLILRDKDHGIIGDVVEEEDSRQGFDFNLNLNEQTLINTGKALDMLEQSVLLGNAARINIESYSYNNTTVISLITSLFDEIKNNITNTDTPTLQGFDDIISLMSNNLIKSEHLSSESSTFWEDEMTSIAPLIVNVYDLMESEDFEISNDLGTALDKSVQSTILGNDTTLQLMNKMIGIIKDSILGEDYVIQNDDSMNDQIFTLMTDIENNLLTTDLYNILKTDNKFWEKEITAIISLKNVADKASTITTISSAKNLASDIDSVYTSRIIPQSSLNNTLSTVIKQLDTGASDGVQGKINQIINNIASDITSSEFWEEKNITNFWQIELDYISTLNNIKFSDDADYKVTDNLKNIGETLDTVTQGTATTRPSYFITEFRVRELLATAIEDTSSNITSSFESAMQNTISEVLEDICNNIYNPTPSATQIPMNSFETELEHIQNLANIEISNDLFKYTSDLAALTNKLQALGSELDAIAFNIKNNTTTNVITFDDEINSAFITRNNIHAIVSSAFEMARSNDPESIFNKLLTRIQTSISNISNNDQVITWQRELSYVATLIQLNSGEEYTLENASEKVAKYTDLISFNTLTPSEPDTIGEFADIEYNESYQIKQHYTYSYSQDTETKYYNSVVISRTIIKDTINELLDDFKTTNPDETETIANELIDNLKSNVNTEATSSTSYNNYANAFKDLNDVKISMESLATSVDGQLYENVNAALIDESLDNFQNKIVSGVITTRKIALLIISKIEETYSSITGFSTTEAGIYLNTLETHYNNNINLNTPENYKVINSTNELDNPFVTLNSKFLS